MSAPQPRPAQGHPDAPGGQRRDRSSGHPRTQGLWGLHQGRGSAGREAEPRSTFSEADEEEESGA